MAQYIDKAAVVAEIEKRKTEINVGGFKSWQEHQCDNCTLSMYDEMKEILNTLEVKEVDLESEVKEYVDANFTSVEEPDLSFTTVMQLDDMIEFAEFFYRLGLMQRKENKL